MGNLGVATDKHFKGIVKDQETWLLSSTNRATPVHGFVPGTAPQLH